MSPFPDILCTCPSLLQECFTFPALSGPTPETPLTLILTLIPKALPGPLLLHGARPALYSTYWWM